jgi:3-deoxy-D-manno-octulosonic-acid transferase
LEDWLLLDEIQLHGASIGELQCLMRLHTELVSRDEFCSTRFFVTYTSTSGIEWLRRVDHPLAATATPVAFYSRISKSSYAGRRRACIIAEKDRLPNLIRAHQDSKFILNVDAKPPQSPFNRGLTRWLGTCERISAFAVENEHYARAIRRFAPAATVDVLGTLKAPNHAPGVERLTRRPRLTFVSAMPHEGPAIARIVDVVRATVRDLQAIVIPRYLIPSRMPGKDGPRGLARLRGAMPDATIVPTIEQLSQALDHPGSVTAIFASLGKVEQVFALSRVAVTAGSLSPGGFVARSKGHNFLEPMAAGLPTLIGPHVQNWQTTVDAFSAEGTLLTGSTATLPEMICALLTQETAFEKHCGAVRSSSLLRYHQGTAARVADLVCSLARQ